MKPFRTKLFASAALALSCGAAQAQALPLFCNMGTAVNGVPIVGPVLGNVAGGNGRGGNSGSGGMSGLSRLTAPLNGLLSPLGAGSGQLRNMRNASGSSSNGSSNAGGRTLPGLGGWFHSSEARARRDRKALAIPVVVPAVGQAILVPAIPPVMGLARQSVRALMVGRPRDPGIRAAVRASPPAPTRTAIARSGGRKRATMVLISAW